MKEPVERILIIAYHFPPAVAVGGVRPANFSRWLARFGWDVRVLTRPRKDLPEVDMGRLEGLDGIAVSSARSLPTALELYARLRALLKRAPKGAYAPPSDPHAVGAPPIRESRIGRWKRYLLSFLVMPDYDRGWILPAAWLAIRIIRKHRISWIMTTCPPYSTHVVGLIAARVTGIRWVADFRDPWMTTGSKRLYPTSKLSLKLESRLERKVIRRANLVVFNVERLRNAYWEKYGQDRPEKFVFIPNAISDADVALASSASKFTEFTMTYTGALYAGRSPEPVFKAIGEIVAENRALRSRIRIKLVGQCNEVQGRPTAEIIRTYGLDGMVELTGSVPHSDAQAMIARSHLALLFAPGLAYQIPAKFYDYLGTGATILAIAEEGATSDIVRATGSGRSFGPEDIHGIKQFILDQMASPSSSNATHRSAAEQYRPANLTRTLSDYLEGSADTDDAAKRP